MRQRFLPLLLLGVWASMGAQLRTTNFIVNAPTPQIAQQVGQLAEQYRRDKAVQWLSREMPPWPRPKLWAGGTSRYFRPHRTLSRRTTRRVMRPNSIGGPPATSN